LFIIIVLFGLLSTQATAASFDCHKATTWLEKTVCSNPELSKLDDELAKAYHDALASLSPEGQEETKQYQRQWLKELSPFCKARAQFEFDDDTAKCLKNYYEERIKALKGILIKFSDRIFRKVYIDDSKIDKTCENNVYVDIGLMYPQIENPRDENEKFWNDLISQKAIDKYKKSREVCTDISSWFSVSFSNRHLISCENSAYIYEHGAPHGYTNGSFLNWLLEARRELQLVDLFDDKTDWRNKLAALITQKKGELEAGYGSRYIAPGEDLDSGLIDIDKIDPSSDWLISKEKNGLAFRFDQWNSNQYVLVAIDWGTLDPYLSKNGRSLIHD
jgi:uncharacterized protein